VYDTVIPFFATIGARLVELAELRPGESVVDVGAGRGATLVPAAERVGPAGRVLELRAAPPARSPRRELRRVVLPGGRVMASVPTGTGPQWGFLGRLFRRFGPRATGPIPMPFRPDFDLGSVLVSAGLALRLSVEESMHFVFADEYEW
jgi:hypothetical protein